MSINIDTVSNCIGHYENLNGFFKDTKKQQKSQTHVRTHVPTPANQGKNGWQNVYINFELLYTRWWYKFPIEF